MGLIESMPCLRIGTGLLSFPIVQDNGTFANTIASI